MAARTAKLSNEEREARKGVVQHATYLSAIGTAIITAIKSAIFTTVISAIF